MYQNYYLICWTLKNQKSYCWSVLECVLSFVLNYLKQKDKNTFALYTGTWFYLNINPFHG